MKKSKKILITLSAIIGFLIISSHIGYRILVLYDLKKVISQIKDGGHVSPAWYINIFEKDELISHFVYNEVPVYVITDKAINRLYHNTGTSYVPGIGIILDTAIWNLKESCDDIFYQFIFAHECGHAINRKISGNDYFSIPIHDSDIDTVIKYESKADAYAILATNISDDEYIDIRNWINFEYSEIGRTALENGDRKMISLLKEVTMSQINTTLELLSSTHE